MTCDNSKSMKRRKIDKRDKGIVYKRKVTFCTRRSMLLLVTLTFLILTHDEVEEQPCRYHHTKENRLGRPIEIYDLIYIKSSLIYLIKS